MEIGVANRQTYKGATPSAEPRAEDGLWESPKNLSSYSQRVAAFLYVRGDRSRREQALDIRRASVVSVDADPPRSTNLVRGNHLYRFILNPVTVDAIRLGGEFTVAPNPHWYRGFTNPFSSCNITYKASKTRQVSLERAGCHEAGQTLGRAAGVRRVPTAVVLEPNYITTPYAKLAARWVSSRDERPLAS